MEIKNNYNKAAEAGWDPISRLTALILCGGRGERLRPLTDELPKPLLSVNGRPLLAYLLEHLYHQGIQECLLCTGYKAELFEQFASEQAISSLKIRCQNTGDADIGKRLEAAAQVVAHERVLICYADTLADVELSELLRVHESSGADATLTTIPYRSAYGIVTSEEEGFVTRFEEKPFLPYSINIGFMLCERAALEKLNSGADFPSFLQLLARSRRLAAYCHRGQHWTANTEKELQDLALELQNQKEMNG
jgi:glucose-1-phosphate cytidylyltransferase